MLRPPPWPLIHTLQLAHGPAEWAQFGRRRPQTMIMSLTEKKFVTRSSRGCGHCRGSGLAQAGACPGQAQLHTRTVTSYWNGQT